LVVLPFAATALADMPMLLINGQQHPSLLQWPARDQSPQRVSFSADMAIASIAASPDGVRYVVSGLDNVIYRVDGGAFREIYRSKAQVRAIGFGRSLDALYFSTVETPQDTNVVPDGALYALSLSSGRVALRFRVEQSTVGGQWWGAFAIDERGNL